MKACFLFCTLFFFYKVTLAQNLIINPEFEDTTLANIAAVQTFSSGELNYFYGKITFGRGITPPTLDLKKYLKNHLSEMSKSGNAAGGGLFYKVNGTKGCLVMRFSEVLIKDESYVFEIYIKHAAGSFALNNLDIALADFDFHYNTGDFKSPSLLNLHRMNSFLVDSSITNKQWEKIKIEFVAKGNEKSIVVGCFGYPKKFIKKPIANQLDSLKGDYAVYLLDEAVLMTRKNFQIFELERKLVPNSIFFDFDENLITDQSKIKLDSLSIILKTNPKAKLSLIGYTDPKGDVNYNEKLALKRAETAMNYLIKKGVSINQLNIISQTIDLVDGINLPSSKYYLLRRVAFVLL